MFYLIVFFILVILSWFNLVFPDKLCRQLLSGISAVILVGVAGLRYETGGDWDVYTRIFNHLPSLVQIIDTPRLLWAYDVEEGFVLLNALIKQLGGNVQWVFFVITSINISLISVSLYRYTKYPVVGLLCYYCILYFSLEMIYIRQAVAVALCFFAIRYIESRKIIPYMLIVLLACTFHRVAVLMVPLYFVLRIKLPIWTYMGIVLFGAIVMLVGFPWITKIFLGVASLLGETYASKAELYTTSAFFATGRKLSVGFVLNLLIFASVLYFKQSLDNHSTGTIHLNMFLLSLVLYYYCFELVEVSNRVRFFFLISIVALLPIILEYIIHWSNQLGVYFVVVLYCFSFSMHIFTEQPRAVAYNPYQNYIEYKIHPRPSTGKQRLEKSHQMFRKDRQ
ncbi:EpsG family protein [bacterium]|nr:EpsG family protein [bacterium]